MPETRSSWNLHKEFALVAATLALLVVVLVALPVRSIQNQGKDALVVNVAGRQRMLLQRMAKQGLAHAAGEDRAVEMRASINLFQETLDGLIAGGPVTSTSGETVILEAWPDQAVQGQLDLVRQQWADYRANLDYIAAAPPGSSTAAAAALEVELASDALVAEMNRGVGALAAVAQAKVAGLRNLLLGLLVVGLGAAYGVWVLLVRRVARPVRRIIRDAVAFGQGDFSRELRADSRLAEIQDLGDTFERLGDFVQRVTVAADWLKEGNFNETLENPYGSPLIDRFEEGRSALQSALAEVRELVDAANEGDLSARADTEGAEGAYGRLLHRVNQLLETVAEPAQEGARVMELVAQGDLRQRVADGAVGDHAILGDSLNQTITELSAMLSQVKSTSKQLDHLSGEILSASEEVATAALTSSDSAVAVVAASQDANLGVQGVASAAEEMFASINEVSERLQNTADSTRVARSAVEGALPLIAELREASGAIGEVTGLIAGIAEQTNLLALNATIEAARAGDAGKGFAVVAGEVKSLASQTARATEDIGDRIRGIQERVERAGHSMGEITEVISQVNEGAVAMAAAVEEQLATVHEIARTATSASSRVDQVHTNIEEVSDAVRGSATSASQLKSTSDELASISTVLDQLVGTFKVA